MNEQQRQAEIKQLRNKLNAIAREQTDWLRAHHTHFQQALSDPQFGRLVEREAVLQRQLDALEIMP